MEIWLVDLFFSRKKFRAKQIFVLSNSMKLAPVQECKTVKIAYESYTETI